MFQNDNAALRLLREHEVLPQPRNVPANAVPSGKLLCENRIKSIAAKYQHSGGAPNRYAGAKFLNEREIHFHLLISIRQAKFEVDII